MRRSLDPVRPRRSAPTAHLARGSAGSSPLGRVSPTGRLSVTSIVPPGVSLLWASASRRRLFLTSQPTPGWVAVRVRTTRVGRREIALNGRAVRDLLGDCRLYQKPRKGAVPVVITVRKRSATDVELVLARAQILEVWS